jgi:starvation-inducible outer membrane lipoprotein
MKITVLILAACFLSGCKTEPEHVVELEKGFEVICLRGVEYYYRHNIYTSTETRLITPAIDPDTMTYALCEVAVEKVTVPKVKVKE